MGFFPFMGEILLVFPTFMGGFPIPPPLRGRSGGGWGIYVAVVLAALHEKAGTLEIAKDQITILCARCPLPKVCGDWGTAGELTCFCLESILTHPR